MKNLIEIIKAEAVATLKKDAGFKAVKRTTREYEGKRRHNSGTCRGSKLGVRLFIVKEGDGIKKIILKDIKMPVEAIFKYSCFYLDVLRGYLLGISWNEHGIKATPIKTEKAKNILEVHFRYVDAIVEFFLDKNKENNINYEVINLSDGYNMGDLPHSCMKGCGHYFESFEGMGKMLVLRDGEGLPRARCNLWDGSFIKKDGKKQHGETFADLIYAHNGDWLGRMIKKLEAEGYVQLWDNINKRLNYHFGELVLEAPAGLLDAIDEGQVCWMDTFNHFNTEKMELASYDWKLLGYAPKNFYFDYASYVLLSTEGYAVSTDSLVWSDYEQQYLDSDDAFYCDDVDSWVSEGNEDFARPERRDGWYHCDNLEVIDGWYYHREDVEWSDYHQAHFYAGDADYVYVDYIDDYVHIDKLVQLEDDILILEDDAVWSNYHRAYLLKEGAFYSTELGDWLKSEDELADANLARGLYA